MEPEGCRVEPKGGAVEPSEDNSARCAGRAGVLRMGGAVWRVATLTARLQVEVESEATQRVRSMETPEEPRKRQFSIATAPTLKMFGIDPRPLTQGDSSSLHELCPGLGK